MEEGEALVQHGDGLVLLQLQRLLKVLHSRHVVLPGRQCSAPAGAATGGGGGRARGPCSIGADL